MYAGAGAFYSPLVRPDIAGRIIDKAMVKPVNLFLALPREDQLDATRMLRFPVAPLG